MSKESSCATCGFRARYDNNPKSFLGRLWRWHAGFCPGFKGYITALPEEERVDLATRYGLKKYL